jgi:hypothetical protein
VAGANASKLARKSIAIRSNAGWLGCNQKRIAAMASMRFHFNEIFVDDPSIDRSVGLIERESVVAPTGSPVWDLPLNRLGWKRIGKKDVSHFGLSTPKTNGKSRPFAQLTASSLFRQKCYNRQIRSIRQR